MDGQRERHHLRLTGLRGKRGACGTVFQVHLDSWPSSICLEEEPDSAESPAVSSAANASLSNSDTNFCV